ncbi:MAG: acyl-CoA dehydrogenase family protein [Chloroflexi bacterium]|nr:acyl-CoA dehydrogenase family protein [Chloroflexota bacterium]
MTEIDRADVGLTPEQQALRQAVREFARSEIAPYVDECERAGRYPIELIQKIGQLGYLGAIVPPEYEGAGLDYVSYGIVCEEIARADWVCASAISVQNSLVCSSLVRFGSEEQKHRYLLPLARGEWLSSACLTEPSGGSDLASIETTARRDGEAYVLNGEKVYISHANHASLYFVLASVDRSLRARGICAFLVERDTPGLTTRSMAMHTLRRGDTAQVIFEDVRVPRANLLAGEGEGFKVVGAALDVGRFSVASRAVGQAQACVDAALDYARQRRQFGQELGRFQMVQAMLADMVTSVEAARLLCRRVGQLKDAGVARASQEASMAKLFATDVCMKVAEDAVQIHGGYGLEADNPVGRYFQEAKVLQIGEGSNQLQRALIAEYALGYRGQRR